MKDNYFKELQEQINALMFKSEIERRRDGGVDFIKQMMLFKVFKVAIVLLFFFYSCNTDPKEKPSTENGVNVAKEDVPNFNADSAFSFVKKQVDFGPRVPNSKAHDDCAKYLVKKFESYGLTVNQQKGVVKGYDGKSLNFNNISAQYQPNNPKRVMISAHWDSRPWADHDDRDTSKPIDAANDGASGVAVMLEIARLISKMKLDVGVDFVCFDIEDYGKPWVDDSYCLGSQHWSKNFPLKYKPIYGVNLDMVGDPSAVFTYEGLSVEYGKLIVDKIWSSAHTLGYGKYFSFDQTSPIIDDHAYVNRYANFPCIDIIDRSTPHSFSATWHTHDDNIKNISPQTLKAVGQTLMFVLSYE
jgi:hypothetical protein